MKRFIFLLAISLAFPKAAMADFGDADFPIGLFMNSPKSYHDVWCREIKKTCRVRFQGPAMWVEGQGGIQISQYLLSKYEHEGGDHYNYLIYKSKDGIKKQALFLIRSNKAQRDFFKAMSRWKRQESLPIPNYRLPASQGPQDTQNRDKGLNPYENPPITDWSEKTTKESPPGINCNSPVYRNKPMCK